MIANLFRPWLLARLSCGLAAAVLAVVGAAVAVRVLRHFRVAATSEGQLALERRAELAAALVEVCLGASLLGLALAVLGADRMTASIRGAMCAWGVLEASPWGLRSLGVSIAASLACALWVALHRLDLGLRAPVLTRAKFTALLAVAPLVVLDLCASTAHALALDLRVVASCCSTGLDGARALVADDASGLPRQLVAGGFVASAVMAIALCAFTRRRPSAAAALAVGGASAAAAAFSVPAVLSWVAPHAYETPAHLCPFCLLHADVLGMGWPLFAALFAGTALGLGAGLVGSLERASGEPTVARALEARLSSGAAVSWAVALAVALAPVVRYAIVSGGTPLFGGDG